ncbi:MAG: serine hydrolase domain-containing protein [Myxococcota bacterium]|nr:serine hydrolase domain-containing protein [Myxococcota bacterium]
MKAHGFCSDGFEGVRQTFESNFDKGRELGACVAVTRDGKPVVDLWGGDADGQGTPWAEDTLVNVYSTTKTMAAICILVLADRGEIDLYSPVAQYWPEFAQAGKEGVTIAHVMSHSAGLSGFDPPLQRVDQLYDWDGICEHLAAQAPWWEPGTQSGYHAVTQGFMQGEVVRRVTGRSLGTFFKEEIAEPLDADFHIGLEPAHDSRVGELQPPETGLQSSEEADPESVVARTFAGAFLDATEPRTEAWRRAEIPAAGGIGNARSVARIHSALACGGQVGGVTLMSEAGVLRALEEQTRGEDLVFGVPMVFGMGFGLNDPCFPVSPNERAFFWGGWGGSVAIIDLDARVSIAYVMNKMQADLMGDTRGAEIAAAVYTSLAQMTV